MGPDLEIEELSNSSLVESAMRTKRSQEEMNLLASQILLINANRGDSGGSQGEEDQSNSDEELHKPAAQNNGKLK